MKIRKFNESTHQKDTISVDVTLEVPISLVNEIEDQFLEMYGDEYERLRGESRMTPDDKMLMIKELVNRVKLSSDEVAQGIKHLVGNDPWNELNLIDMFAGE